MKAEEKRRGRWQSAGLMLVPTCLLLVSLFLPRGAATEIDLPSRLQPPTANHPLGTDELGRDLLARVAAGATRSLLLSVMVVLSAAAAGALFGGLSALAGGVADRVMLFALDVVQAFPGVLLAMALSVFLGRGVLPVAVALAASAWPAFARLTRSLTAELISAPFIDAQRAIGSGASRILARHLVPHLLASLTTQMALALPQVVLAEGALGFLGLGLPAEALSWGALIDEGRRHLVDAPRLMMIPGLALLATTLGVSFLAERRGASAAPRRRSGTPLAFARIFR